MDGKRGTAPASVAVLLLLVLCGLLLVPSGEAVTTSSDEEGTLCSLPACFCDKDRSGWITINCTFAENQEVSLKAGSLSRRVREVSLSGGRSLHVGCQCFTGLQDPVSLAVRGAKVVRLARHAFLNMTANHLVLDVHDCKELYVETAAFKNAGGPPTVTISNCGHVVLEKEPFFCLNQINITNVPNLVLNEGAFVFERIKQLHHGPVTKISFRNVVVKNLPNRTFGSPVDEIRLEQTEVRDVHGGAFSAVYYNIVIAINSTFYKFYKEAFSDKTHMTKLQLYNCSIDSLASDALLSGTTNLTITNCKLKEVASGAVMMTAAKVTLKGNEFGKIHKKGFEFDSWDRMEIDENVFDELEPNSIVCPAEKGKDLYFSFVDNGMFIVAGGSLKFISEVQSVHSIEYKNNYFDTSCICDMDKWLKYVFDDVTVDVQSLMDNSYCTVKDSTIAICYNVFEGSMLIKNFSQEMCNNETKIKCIPAITKLDGTNKENQNTKFLHRKNQLKEAKETELWNKRILGLVFIVALCGIIIILIITLIACARRRGYCVDIKNALISSNNCCIKIIDRIFNINYGLDTARSISRLSVHEYNESHRLNETRITNVENGAEEIEQLIDEDVPMFDKTTQTLPEELTKELLESLREKLDDPENYSEAREMIEHLYDLIKVEESCNANNNVPLGNSQNFGDDQDNLYDVIQVPVRRQGKNKKLMVNVGTKVPSIEKLTAFSPYTRQTALCHEYFEPKDRAMHLYCELPGPTAAGAVGSSNMPDVIGEKSPRPLSFLRAIGEKIQPTEDTGTAGSSRSAHSGRMANRPLPERPKDPGEGTSFQKP